MRRLRILVMALLLGGASLAAAAPAHAVYCGNLGGIDPCAAVCRVGYVAHLKCVFGP